MAQGSTTAVKDLRDFMRATARAERASKRLVRDQLRVVGDVVKVEAQQLFQKYDAVSAAGFRTVVRQRGVSVEQRLKRTTGQRPQYGGLQMRRALLPALDRNQEEIVERFDDALDVIAAHFERN